MLNNNLKFLLSNGIIFYGPIDRIMKLEYIKENNIKTCQLRFEFLKNFPLEYIPKLYHYSVYRNGKIILIFEFIFGLPLITQPNIHPNFSIFSKIILKYWRKSKFIHGDIKPDHFILCDGNVIVIDCLSNLKSSKGHPDFSSLLCVLNIHNHFTDRIAFKKCSQYFKKLERSKSQMIK